MYDTDEKSGKRDHEFQDVVAYRCDRPLGRYAIDPTEVLALAKVDVEAFDDLCRGTVDKIRRVEAIAADKGQIKKATLSLTRNNIARAWRDYLWKTALFLDMIANGQQPPERPYRFEVTGFL
ncbi:MAG: hypothetical protein ABH879_04435 [archaeon]